jgi:hypothetical protein
MLLTALPQSFIASHGYSLSKQLFVSLAVEINFAMQLLFTGHGVVFPFTIPSLLLTLAVRQNKDINKRRWLQLKNSIQRIRYKYVILDLE